MLVNKTEQEIIDRIKKTFFNMAYGYYCVNFPEPVFKRDTDGDMVILFKNEDYDIELIFEYYEYLMVYAEGEQSIFLAKKFLIHHGHEFENHSYIKG